MSDLLMIEHVYKKYPKFELKDVSFSIPQGAIVGFIGRNGAGKTTTLKGIMNLIHFDQGEVTAFGKNMKDSELEAKQNIGFTLAELAYYPNKTIAQIIEVTSRFYEHFSHEKFNKLCEHFKLDQKKKIEQLSSGMKVKYSLAVALSYDAKLLILDEPTSGLDPISRDEILELFQNIIQNRERAILFSTHITSDLDKCATHIVYIFEGVIRYFGTKENFISSYKIVTGEPASFDNNLRDLCLSFKEFNNTFEGLIRTEDSSEFKNAHITTIKPDLDQIMIYLERGKNYEKFDF